MSEATKTKQNKAPRLGKSFEDAIVITVSANGPSVVDTRVHNVAPGQYPSDQGAGPNFVVK